MLWVMSTTSGARGGMLRTHPVDDEVSINSGSGRKNRGQRKHDDFLGNRNLAHSDNPEGYLFTSPLNSQKDSIVNICFVNKKPKVEEFSSFGFLYDKCYIFALLLRFLINFPSEFFDISV